MQTNCSLQNNDPYFLVQDKLAARIKKLQACVVARCTHCTHCTWMHNTNVSS